MSAEEYESQTEVNSLKIMHLDMYVMFLWYPGMGTQERGIDIRKETCNVARGQAQNAKYEANTFEQGYKKLWVLKNFRVVEASGVGYG